MTVAAHDRSKITPLRFAASMRHARIRRADRPVDGQSRGDFPRALLVAAMVDLAILAAQLRELDSDPERVFYLGHLFDLSADTIQSLRVPSFIAASAIAVVLPLHLWFKRSEHKAAVLAGGMAVLFAAADLGFAIFAPRLTTKPLA